MAGTITEPTVLTLASRAVQGTIVPARLLAALAYKESGREWPRPPAFGRGTLNIDNPGAAGERGLAQVKPSTARSIGFRDSDSALAEPATNLLWAARYLEDMRRRFGSWGSALSAYNAGPGRVAAGYRGNLQTYARPILERAGIMGPGSSSSSGVALSAGFFAAILLGLGVILFQSTNRGRT